MERWYQKYPDLYVDISPLNTILNIALDVHGVTTGSFDFDPLLQQKVECLEYALASWQESIGQNSVEFDNCAKTLIECVLEDYDYRTEIQKG